MTRRFTTAEVLEILESEDIPYTVQTKGWRDDSPWEDSDYRPILDDGWTEIDKTRVNIEGEWYEFEMLEETGGMDQGSNASVTFKFGDQYFQKHGYYASHYGYDWDGDFNEVEPYTKKVVDYRKVKN